MLYPPRCLVDEPRPRGLLPSRAGARWNAGKPFGKSNVVGSDNATDNAAVNQQATDGLPTPDQHRITARVMRRWSFPAHTRTEKRRNVVGPPPPSLRRFSALRAWTESVLSTRQQATGAGLITQTSALGNANVAPPEPPPFGRPVRKAGLMKPVAGFQVFSHRPAS